MGGAQERLGWEGLRRGWDRRGSGEAGVGGVHMRLGWEGFT